MTRTLRSTRSWSCATVALTMTAGLMVASTTSSRAAETVAARDNRFDPRETRIDPGDTVVWANQGSRDHTVTSDKKGQFNSGVMRPTENFRHTFEKEGYYYYFCRQHGARGQVGMWGLVIVGDLPPPPDGSGGTNNVRPKLVVPRDFPTIQKAVDAAEPGSTVLIRPGIYRETVSVTIPRLVIRGVDRFRTILHGGDKRVNGIIVDRTRNVRVTNLTVRNYTGNGIFFNKVHGYRADHIDAIKNRTYGIYAFDSYNGVIRRSFGWGSGDSAFYIGQCLGCGGLIERVKSMYNFLGYSGTNATGVVIRNSVFKHNGAGIVPNTLPFEELGPNRGTLMYDNVVVKNNYKTIPAKGFSETVNIPFGTGIWMAGVSNNVARDNFVANHDSYGILITQGIDQNSIPMNNRVVANTVRNSDANGDGYGYDLAWDGTGADNCFTANRVTGATGPPEIQTIYACANRPFAGAPYPPVQAHVAASLCCPETREQKEPPEPRRPRCQRGRPGCSR
ncbi:MAG: plastocyanin/azurin family copper-binding protein [Actinomycetota bacterium]|nr:plastocyanin/azurin family copper-binding protein [Actinomycetota bacterium]